MDGHPMHQCAKTCKHHNLAWNSSGATATQESTTLTAAVANSFSFACLLLLSCTAKVLGPELLAPLANVCVCAIRNYILKARPIRYLDKDMYSNGWHMALRCCRRSSAAAI